MRVLIVTQATNIEQVQTVEELMVIRAQLKIIDADFQELKLDTPDWVTDMMGEVNHEIDSRLKGELQRRLKAARARRNALKTADEKRKDLDDEIASLETKLR